MAGNSFRLQRVIAFAALNGIQGDPGDRSAGDPAAASRDHRVLLSLNFSPMRLGLAKDAFISVIDNQHYHQRDLR